MNRTTADYLNILLAVVEGRNLTDGNVLRLMGHDLASDDVTRLRELVTVAGHAFLANCAACGHEWSADDEPSECPRCFDVTEIEFWFRGDV